MNLEEWRESGLQLIKALRVRGEEESFRRLLSELYPKTAHFIFELFQNAEDTGAKEVKFVLKDDGLVFQHDGPKLFGEKDVIAITSFANSTKRNDPTSIGKFGVGFKAVFAYTNTPEIHSGEFHFRIHDLVVPEFEGVPKPRIGDRETNFTFPFNNPEKLPEKAISEIESGLQGLGHNTLLFLNHIERVAYRLTDGTLGSLQRLDHDNGYIEISSNSAGNRISSRWLRFQKNVNVTDEDGNIKERPIAIAFKLEEEKENWKVVPANPGEVSIYFPAEKETSNLRFHMHAPFASTVARDSVRDCLANKELRNHLAVLVVESLFKIRDQGLLSVNFLAVLPNPEDNLSKFYEPIRVAIVEAFKNEALTPTRSGSHASATELYRGPVSISSVLNDEDIALLTDGEPPLWAANPPPQSRRVENFLDSLDIEEWEWDELSNALHSGDTDKQRIIENWIAQKSDAWILRFYALLGEAHDQHYKCLFVQKLHIVRVESEQGHDHVTPEQAFFPPEQEGVLPPEIHFVKSSVYSSGRSEPQKKSATSFLQYIGVRPYGAKAEVELILKKYRDGEKISHKNNIWHVRQFIALWIEYRSTIEMFKEVKFLRSDNEIEVYCKAADLYLDAPYVETGMAALFNDPALNIKKQKARISNCYSVIKNFIEFVSALGVMRQLEICEHSATKMQKDEFNYSGRAIIDQDYYINGLWWRREASDGHIDNFELDNTASMALSAVIWRMMSKTDPKYLEARYQKRNQPIKSKTSFLVDYLSKRHWVPDREGNFHRPCEVTQETLHPDFIFDDRNGWLSAVKFGEHSRISSEGYQRRNEQAKSFGFSSVDTAKKWAECEKLGMSPDEFISKHKQTEQPGESVRDPVRRRAGVLERSDNAPEKESVRRERLIQSGIQLDTAEAKAYLRAKYTNTENQLICQCCQNEMPFKIGEDHYFEAILCLRNLDRRYYENRLALCPTCAAMYQHANETDNDEMRRRLIELTADDTALAVEIPVHLAGRDFALRFVGTHWFDLKTILLAK